MLQNIAIKDGGRLDLDAVGRLIIRLMEIETSFKHPQAQRLAKPDAWNAPIREFLEKIFVSTLQVLLRVWYLLRKRLISSS